MAPKRPTLISALGPGLLWAGTAIGVSHLVQATRAGAGFGLSLVWLVVLAHVFKYPAFEVAPRYTAATGQSLLTGYRKLGKFALVSFLLLTIGTMFTVLAAVIAVTAGLIATLIPLGPLSTVIPTDQQPIFWSIALLAGAAGLLAVGRFKLLESFMKVMMLVLTASTLLAVVLLLPQVNVAALSVAPQWPSMDKTTMLLIVGLVGWMPSAIDIAVWQSLWSLEKARTEKKPLTREGSRFDFNVGYMGTAVMALGFVFLGAGTLFGTGREIPGNGVAFAGLLVDVYAAALGDWSRPLILIAALSTMVSTTLTVSDGFPRAIEGVWHELWEPGRPVGARTWVYWAATALCGAGALSIIASFSGQQFKLLIDLATSLTCLTAPGLATLNFFVARSADMPEDARPSRAYAAFHVAGIVFLLAFAGFFCYARFFVG